MMTMHLALLSAVATRLPRRRRVRRLLTRALGAGRRLAAALGRPLRRSAPPVWRLNNYLRRDIGLDPASDSGRWHHWR